METTSELRANAARNARTDIDSAKPRMLLTSARGLHGKSMYIASDHISALFYLAQVVISFQLFLSTAEFLGDQLLGIRPHLAVVTGFFSVAWGVVIAIEIRLTGGARVFLSSQSPVTSRLLDVIFLDGRDYYESRKTSFRPSWRRLLARGTLHRVWIRGSCFARKLTSSEKFAVLRS